MHILASVAHAIGQPPSKAWYGSSLETAAPDFRLAKRLIQKPYQGMVRRLTARLIGKGLEGEACCEFRAIS